MSNALSPPSTTASETIGRASSSPPGLSDDKLRVVHKAAAKMACLGRNAQPVGAANLRMPQSAPAVSRQEFEARHMMAKKQTALLDSGAPLRHLRNSVDSQGGWGKVCSQLQDMLGTGFMVVLMGGKGKGKTQMATELIRFLVQRALENERPCNTCFATMMQFWMSIKESFRSDGPTESTTVATFAAYDFLVLDEAHRRSESQYFQDLLDEMLNRRYNAMKDTFLLTTLEPGPFAESVGAAVYQRIAETGLEIECDWPSFRDP